MWAIDRRTDVGEDARRSRRSTTMPTWGEIQEFARSKYKLDGDEEDWFSLVFAYDNNRSQKVWVRRFTSFDMEWCEFRSVVCKESEMAHRVALKKNIQFSVG